MKEPLSVSQEREQFLREKRKDAMVVHEQHFLLLSNMYLSSTPPLHVAAFRLKNGIEGIIIDYDQFQTSWSQDYTNLIDLEIEHEAQELWLTRGKTNIDPFGPDHYAAIIMTLSKALQEGKLELYMAMKEEQLRSFHAFGDDYAMKELEFYIKEADQLRESRKYALIASKPRNII